MSFQTSSLTAAAEAIGREVRLAAHLGPHLLRSAHAFIDALPPATSASQSRWAPAAPILADCADWAAARAADAQSDAVAVHAARLHDALTVGGDAGGALRDLLTIVIMQTPIATAAEAAAFLAALDSDAHPRLAVDLAEAAATETFDTAAAVLALAFERGDGLSARWAVNVLLSFVVTEPSA